MEVDTFDGDQRRQSASGRRTEGDIQRGKEKGCRWTECIAPYQLYNSPSAIG